MNMLSVLGLPSLALRLPKWSQGVLAVLGLALGLMVYVETSGRLRARARIDADRAKQNLEASRRHVELESAYRDAWLRGSRANLDRVLANGAF